MSKTKHLSFYLRKRGTGYQEALANLVLDELYAGRKVRLVIPKYNNKDFQSVFLAASLIRKGKITESVAQFVHRLNTMEPLAIRIATDELDEWGRGRMFDMLVTNQTEALHRDAKLAASITEEQKNICVIFYDTTYPNDLRITTNTLGHLAHELGSQAMNNRVVFVCLDTPRDSELMESQYRTYAGSAFEVSRL